MKPDWYLTEKEKRDERRFISFMLALAATVIIITMIAAGIGRGVVAIHETTEGIAANVR
jgi:hypothetical protein